MHFKSRPNFCVMCHTKQNAECPMFHGPDKWKLFTVNNIGALNWWTGASDGSVPCFEHAACHGLHSWLSLGGEKMAGKPWFGQACALLANWFLPVNICCVWLNQTGLSDRPQAQSRPYLCQRSISTCRIVLSGRYTETLCWHDWFLRLELMPCILKYPSSSWTRQLYAVQSMQLLMFFKYSGGKCWRTLMLM